MALWFGEGLAGESKHGAILTRGYRGTLEAGAEGDSSTRGLPQSDEVALLRDRLSGTVSLGVCPDRYKNGEALARHGVDLFTLNDRFQHLNLRRDADIVILDATCPRAA